MEIKHMNSLEMIAEDAELKDREKDHKGLEYVNNIPLPHGQAYLRNQYKNYYFACKRDFKEKRAEILDQLDIFRKDI